MATAIINGIAVTGTSQEILEIIQQYNAKPVITTTTSPVPSWISGTEPSKLKTTTGQTLDTTPWRFES